MCLWAVRADGQEFQIEASISQVVTGGKKLFTVILRDVTERKQAEERLRKSEENYRMLWDSMTRPSAPSRCSSTRTISRWITAFWKSIRLSRSRPEWRTRRDEEFASSNRSRRNIGTRSSPGRPDGAGYPL